MRILARPSAWRVATMLALAVTWQPGVVVALGVPLLAAGQAELDVADDWTEERSPSVSVSLDLGSLSVAGTF